MLHALRIASVSDGTNPRSAASHAAPFNLVGDPRSELGPGSRRCIARAGRRPPATAAGSGVVDHPVARAERENEPVEVVAGEPAHLASGQAQLSEAAGMLTCALFTAR
jgi:hypothetical protein